MARRLGRGAPWNACRSAGIRHHQPGATRRTGRARGIACTRVPVYHWALPEDLEPLRSAVRSMSAGTIDVIVFLTAVQVVHLVQVAEQMSAKDDVLKEMRKTVVLSIGPAQRKNWRGSGSGRTTSPRIRRWASSFTKPPRARVTCSKQSAAAFRRARELTAKA